jgi:hypothetical protein
MKTIPIVLAALLILTACGGESARTDSPEQTATPVTGTSAGVQPSAAAAAWENPCAPLEAEMVRYPTAGKPFLFSFEIPRGFTVNEHDYGDTISADVTYNAGERGEFILRLVQTRSTRIDNSERLVDGWRKTPYTEKVIEHEVAGRTMLVQRSRMGEMVGFNALFPDFSSESGAFMVIGGVTSAPKPCRDQAADMVERMIASFERNERVGVQQSN